MTLENLRIQIDTDYADLLEDIKAGLFDGRMKDEQKAWARLDEKIRHYQILKEQEREQEQILNEQGIYEGEGMYYPEK